MSGSSSSASKYYALALFTGAYAFNHVDRQIIGVLIEPIRAEFVLTDTQIGLLVGIFMVPYMLVGPALGYWSDRGNRRNILAGCLLLWSGLTAACGFAKSYVQLLFFRALVGAGEAGCNPTTMSLISDLFPPAKRSSALGIYGIGTSIGSLIAFSAGGWIAGTYGWRYALILVAIPGVIIGLLVFFTLSEPARGLSENRTAEADKPPGFFETFTFMWSQKQVQSHVVAMVCFVTAYASILTWLAAFYSRSHAQELSSIGPFLGLIVGVVGASGSLVGGVCADWFRKKGQPYVPVFLGLTYLACAPFALLGFFVPDTGISLAFFAAWAFCGGLGTGPQFALLQGMVGIRMRGTAVAVLSILLNLFAFYGGPQLVGILSDFWSLQGQESLRYALSCICVLYALAAVFCWRTSLAIRVNADATAPV